MVTLSRKQRRLLKKLSKHPISSSTEISDDMSAYAYLKEAGYIVVEADSNISNLPNGFIGIEKTIKSISISEKGKAYLYEEHQITTVAFVLPTIISVASLAVSIFALFLSEC